MECQHNHADSLSCSRSVAGTDGSPSDKVGSLAGKTNEQQMGPAFGVMIALSDALSEQNKTHPTSTNTLAYRWLERDGKRPNGSSGQKN